MYSEDVQRIGKYFQLMRAKVLNTRNVEVRKIRHFNFRLLNAYGATHVRQLVSYKPRVHDSG